MMVVAGEMVEKGREGVGVGTVVVIDDDEGGLG